MSLNANLASMSQVDPSELVAIGNQVNDNNYVD